MTRFVVRELTGYPIDGGGQSGGNTREGTTVWVADEAYNGREVQMWRTEDRGTWGNGIHRDERLRLIRAEARALADRLNSEEE